MEVSMDKKENNFFTIAEVAHRLEVSYSKAFRMIQSGEIKAYRCGAQWRVAPLEVDRYLKRIKKGTK